MRTRTEAEVGPSAHSSDAANQALYRCRTYYSKTTYPVQDLLRWYYRVVLPRSRYRKRYQGAGIACPRNFDSGPHVVVLIIFILNMIPLNTSKHMQDPKDPAQPGPSRACPLPFPLPALSAFSTQFSSSPSTLMSFISFKITPSFLSMRESDFLLVLVAGLAVVVFVVAGFFAVTLTSLALPQSPPHLLF